MVVFALLSQSNCCAKFLQPDAVGFGGVMTTLSMTVADTCNSISQKAVLSITADVSVGDIATDRFRAKHSAA